ncbi:MAG: alpha-amylase family glycosyl hydrolase [Bacteroidia bacterium]
MKNITKLLMLLLFGLPYIGHTQKSSRSDSGTYPSLDPSKIRLYQVYMRNFSPEGTIQGLYRGLDHIQSLGFNTLWLMPVHPVGQVNRKGTFGSPYSVKDYRKINPEFGTEQDFKALVRECHRRGIYVLLDWVANHTAFDHPWTQTHPAWYTRDAQGKILPPNDDWTDVADLNFDNNELREAMIAEMEYWVKEYQVDGFRCDVAMMVPGDWWTHCIQQLRKHRPLFMLAEASGPEFYRYGFNSTYGWDFYHQLKGVFKGGSLKGLDSAWTAENQHTQQAALGMGRVMRFVTNHDETSWDQVPAKVFGSDQAAMAAYVLSQQPISIPLVYNGQEVGHPMKQNIFERSPIRYDLHPEILQFYRDYGDLFRREPAYQSQDFVRLRPDDKDCWWSVRGQGDDAVLCVVNTRNKTVLTAVPNPYRLQSFVNLRDGSTAYLKEEFEIEPYGIRLFKAYGLTKR